MKYLMCFGYQESANGMISDPDISHGCEVTVTDTIKTVSDEVKNFHRKCVSMKMNKLETQQLQTIISETKSNCILAKQGHGRMVRRQQPETETN